MYILLLSFGTEESREQTPFTGYITLLQESYLASDDHLVHYFNEFLNILVSVSLVQMDNIS